MKNFKKGFTIIELLIVIAIIGILATVIIASLSDSTKKSKTAAFKKEISSLKPALVMACDSAGGINSTNISTLIIASKTHNAGGTINGTPSCGFSGAGTFSVTINSINGAVCTSATITQNGATFLPAGC